MKTIRLHGWLGKQFGKTFRINVQSPAEAIRALSIQIPGFKRALADDVEGFKLFAASSNLGEPELLYPFSEKEVLHIVPVVGGASEGKSGGMMILMGIVLIAAAFFTMGASWAGTYPLLYEAVMTGLTTFGTALILGGVSTLLFAPPKPTSTERPENRPSYNFNGPVNTVQQGGGVPVLYGELICGSQVVSAGLFVEDIHV